MREGATGGSAWRTPAGRAWRALAVPVSGTALLLIDVTTRC
jgi:hypothetical protein